MFSEVACHNIHQVPKQQWDLNVQDSCTKSKLKIKWYIHCRKSQSLHLCSQLELTTTAQMRANSWGLTNSHRICHWKSGTGSLEITSSGVLLLTSTSQRATQQNKRAETVRTAGPRMNFKAGDLDVREGEWRMALWVRFQIRCKALAGCCVELCVWEL